MKIIIANRYGPPDESATSRMVGSLARLLARAGHDVTILASRSRHDDPSAELPAQDRDGAVSIRRIATTRFGRHRLAGRAVDYVTFHLSAFRALAALSGRGDVVIVCTDPPLLAVGARLATAARGARLVEWVMDLFPEVAGRLGMIDEKGLAFRAARRLRDAASRRADRVLAISARMRTALVARGIPADKVAVLAHWSDGSEIRPQPGQGLALRHAWGLEGRFVVGYSGNLGRAHEFDTVLDAASRLAGRPDIAFLFVGGGHRHGGLEAEIRRRGLTNVVTQPLQPRERLAEALAVPDIHLVSLRPEMEDFIVPSKFYGICAAGRPTLFVGAPDGEIAGLVRANGCGATIEIGDAEGLANLVERLATKPDTTAAWGRSARDLFDRAFTEDRASRDWAAILAEFERPAPQADRRANARTAGSGGGA